MKTMTRLSVTIIDAFNEIHKIDFKRYEYPNLMELIIDNYYEEIGDCGGKGLCGTCHIKPLSILIDDKDITEIQTLNKLQNSTKMSRLSCQILVNEKINGMSFKLINEN
ncbi:ferredoxin [Aquimarina sp. AD10]|uniref:2Fe-2S ferredoxin-type domain-containing protein n=1 Tax=Aquimarina aggregata TaxID=1642818 RepID=A0A163CZY5_9FLAO|nr:MULTISPECIES: 2Fe-2S iron-sulfur cluster-binding protein [Aquimarina]AXT62701.1 ferredoxin [Aquimarina sp. AD10]KZS42891.1 hypothetical protein AWE51_16115 [Aquimarina aggregata]RKN01884.1 ferredoxin [Aquimarina sp. AD10]